MGVTTTHVMGEGWNLETIMAMFSMQDIADWIKKDLTIFILVQCKT